MPKGLNHIDIELLDKFRNKFSESFQLPLNTNKSYDALSVMVFEKTHVRISKSTLRRLFQYNSAYLPTKSSLDIVAKSIGYLGWDNFVEIERTVCQYDLSQMIMSFQLGGFPEHTDIPQLFVQYKNNPLLFNLLEILVNKAISNKDINFLSNIFNLPNLFTPKQDALKIYFFIHNLVYRLNESGLMSQLIETYGENKNAQVHMVEWYVDEDHLDGYYYDLLQVYHQHKQNSEALLFYYCLMYQHEIKSNRDTSKWLDLIKSVQITDEIHPIPRARMWGSLLLETNNIETEQGVMTGVKTFIESLNEDDKIICGLKIARLLFIKRKPFTILQILKLIPEHNGFGKNIWTRININQLKIYRAYALFEDGNTVKAKEEMEKFNKILVNNFIRECILVDFHTIHNLIYA